MKDIETGIRNWLGEVAALLQGRNGAQPIGFTYVSTPTVRKRRAHGRVNRTITKVAEVSGMLAVDYARIRNAELIANGEEPNYTPAPRKWGERQGNLVRPHY